MNPYTHQHLPQRDAIQTSTRCSPSSTASESARPGSGASPSTNSRSDSRDDPASLIERVAVALLDLGIDDVVIGASSRTEYQRLEKRLLRSGCTQPTHGPICRWLIAGVPVDLMPVDATTIGFTNRWYAAMMAHALTVRVNTRTVRIANAPYFIATKPEAFAHHQAAPPRPSRRAAGWYMQGIWRPEPVS